MSSEQLGWVRPAADGCILRLWVGPGASRAGIAGVHGDALRVRVTAPPEDGAANREVVRLLASRLGVRPRDVELASGAGARRKEVRIRGLRAEEVRDRLASGLSVDTSPDEN
jgi:uncharacterized protein (TIGR00251 family)